MILVIGKVWSFNSVCDIKYGMGRESEEGE